MMRLQDYFQVLRKRWWLIGLVAFVAALSALVISKLQTPVYRLQARYSATPNRVDSGAYMFAPQTLSSYIQLVHNRETFDAIQQQLKLDINPDKLLADVRMQPQPSDLVIVIEADSPRVENLRPIVDAVGNALVAKAAEKNRLLEGQDRINVQRVDVGNVNKAKPQTKINTLAGGLLGLILGVLLAFVLEFLDDTLKTSGDIERFTGLTTIGLIPSGAAQPARRNRRAAPVAALVDRKEAHVDR